MGRNSPRNVFIFIGPVVGLDRECVDRSTDFRDTTFVFFLRILVCLFVYDFRNYWRLLSESKRRVEKSAHCFCKVDLNSIYKSYVSSRGDFGRQSAFFEIEEI